MSKFIILLVVASFAACITADDDDDAASDFLQLGKPFDMMKGFMDIPMNLGEEAIKSIKGIPNGHVSGSFKSHSHSEKTVNGQKVEDNSEDHDLKNVDGEQSGSDADN